MGHRPHERAAVGDEFDKGGRCVGRCETHRQQARTYVVVVPVPLSSYHNRQETKEHVDGSGKHTFVWEQPVSMPSYLVALAVGELEARDISPRWVFGVGLFWGDWLV